MTLFRPTLERLETRDCPSTLAYATGSGPRAPGTVAAFTEDDPLRSVLAIWRPFGDAFTGGLRVATADLDGDGKREIIVGTGPGAPTTVLVYDGAALEHRQLSLTLTMQPFGPSFAGGCHVAAEPGRIVVGADSGGGPQVSVYQPDGTLTAAWNALAPSFRGGVQVACDGAGGIVTAAGPGGGPQVNVYNPDFSLAYAFFAFNPTFTGGVTVAAGDLGSDGITDIVCGQREGRSNVVVYRSGQPALGFWVGGFPTGIGTHVGISGVNRDTLYVVQDNLPYFLMYRGTDLAANVARAYWFGWVPPGLYTQRPPTPASAKADPSLGFEPALGGWIG